jgi:uncharacterized membrane protein
VTLGRIEAYLYSSGTAGVRSISQDLKLAESVGPATETCTPASTLLFDDALTAWQAAANASATLNNTYSIGWNVATQSVKIARTVGASTFHPNLAGDLPAVLGFADSVYADGTTFTGEQQALGRFDDLRISLRNVREGARVDVQEYRLGRAEARSFGRFDVADVAIVLRWADAKILLRSYCVTGRVRVWQTTAVATVYSSAETRGYLDGWVLSVDKPRPIGPFEEWAEIVLRVGVPRA